MAKTTNVLPNTYVPVLSPKVTHSILSRLPKKSLCELIVAWCKVPKTQPVYHKKDNYGNSKSQDELNAAVTTLAREASGITKKKLVDLLVFRFWPNGLNLLQLSQVDSQILVDRPNAFLWIKSTVKDSLGSEVPILLLPEKFLKSLVAELSQLYLTYVYVCRHPRIPLYLIRVQVFDLQSINMSISSMRPHIASRRPYFLAIPFNSPHIIHSPGSDMVTQLVLQCVQRTLPQNPNNLLALDTDLDQKPIQLLESMHILNGCSRFRKSLGIWTPYADGTADVLPLTPVEMYTAGDKENEHVGEKETNPVGQKERTPLKTIANLRFKGSVDGKLKSTKLFDDNKSFAIRARTEDEDELMEAPSEYASITPVQYAEFTIRDSIKNDGEEAAIKLKFSGADVFAGLHELSVMTNDKAKMVVDPATIPGYLTGEEGESCGEVLNSKFTSGSRRS